jgi:outer membrane lipoprotein carrier protein
MNKFLAFFWLFLLANAAIAETDDTEALLAALRPIQSMQGQFSQQQYDSSNTLLATSAGQFRLLRPGYFSWEITSPGSQLIIADPQYVWQYDRDLETVTRRPVDDSEQMSPLQVLGGNETLLRSRFSVEQTAVDIFSLLPKGINPGFLALQVTFSGNSFASLEIADNLNQRIVIAFSQVDSESKLVVEDFSFIPPPEADLFYYDQ